MKLKELGVILLAISIPMMFLSIVVFDYMQLFYVSLGIFIVALAAFSISDKYIFPYVIREMIESSAINIEAIAEEFDIKGKAIYLIKDGRSIAFIPFFDGEVNPDFVKKIMSLPLRVVNDSGITVFVPMPPIKKEGEMSDESFVKQVLIEYLDFADDVKLIKSDVNGKIVFKINIIKPKGKYINIPRYEKCLGSLEGSIALSALSRYYEKPVKFLSENKTMNGIIVEGELIG